MTDNSSIGTRDDGAPGSSGTPDQRPKPPSRASGPSSQRPQEDRTLQPPRRATRRPSARLLANVETLVRKLSRQNLQQWEEANQEPAPSSSSASSRPPPQTTSPSAVESTTESEGICHPERPLTTPVVELTDLPASDDPLNPGCPIEIDQDEISTPLLTLSNLDGGEPDGDPMDMQYDPPPLLEAPQIIEPVTLPGVAHGMVGALDVDPAYLHGGSEAGIDDETVLLEHFRAMRRTMAPGGAVRRTVAGSTLRYRLSADVALGCQNVVRSRPRMRKRPDGDRPKRSRAESFVSSSSAVPSVASSPAAHPSHPTGPSPPMPPYL